MFTTCDVCLQAKHQRLSFHSKEASEYALFDLIRCDLWGPYKQSIHGQCDRFLTIGEEFSKCTWVFLLSDKSQVSLLLQNFIVLIKNQFQVTIKTDMSDNGTEFVNKFLHQFFQNTGIVHQKSCPTPTTK